MPEEIILNKRTDQLPLSVGPEPGFFIPMWNTNLQRTERVNVGQFISSSNSQNFEWLTDTTYLIGEAVTRSGKWWQAQQAVPINIVPGTDPAYWLEVNKSYSFTFWSAGVYSEENVFVFYSLEGEVHLMYLTDLTRPFVSVDFETEYEVGMWVSITQNKILKSAALGAGTLSVDMYLLKQRSFKTVIVTEDKVLSVLNDDNAIEWDLAFEVNGLHTITLPAGYIVSGADNAEWDNGTKEWTPLDIGKYFLSTHKDNDNEWLTTIEGPY